MSKAHLEVFQAGVVINVKGGKTFREKIAPIGKVQSQRCRIGVTLRKEKN